MTGPAGQPAGRAAGRAAGTTAAGTTAAGSTATPSGTTAPAPPPRTPADAADPAPAPAPGARRRAPWWLVGLLGLLAVAGLVATAVLLTRPSEADLRASALQAARTYTQTLTTFDARTLDEDVAAVQKVSTDDFDAQYAETIEGIRDRIQTEQTVSVGTVVGVGLERLEGDEAVVLVAVDAEITAAGQPPRTEANRLRVALVRRDGTWFLQGVDRL